jgi:hypothetical protein
MSCAAHVVQNRDRYTLVTPDGQHQLDASKTVILEGVDLALVQFTSQKFYSVAKLARYNLNEQFWVFVSGFPKLEGKKQPQRLLTAGLVSQEVEPILRPKTVIL